MTTILTNGNSDANTLTDNNGGFLLYFGTADLSHGDDSLFTDDVTYVAEGATLKMGTGSDVIYSQDFYAYGDTLLESGHDSLSSNYLSTGSAGLVDFGSGNDTANLLGQAYGSLMGGTGYDSLNVASGQYQMTVTPIDAINLNIQLVGSGINLNLEEFELINGIDVYSLGYGTQTITL